MNSCADSTLKWILLVTFIGMTMLVSFPTFADDWFCSEASSRREGKDFVVCGVSKAGTRDLAAARESALDAAKREFHTLCRESSADCLGRQTSIEPMRTACSMLADGTVQCFRSIRYRISDQLSDSSALDTTTPPTTEYESTASNKSLSARKGMNTHVSDYQVRAGGKLQNANGDRQIILSTVPPASQVQVLGKVTRTIKISENPATILVHRGDKELLVSAEAASYKSKSIKLDPGSSSQDLGIEILQLFLEKK